MRLLPLLVCVALAGCAAAPAPDAPAPPASSSALRVGEALLHHGGGQGGLALLHLAEGGSVEVELPEGVLVLDEEGRLLPPAGPIALAEGKLLQYLPPYAATNVTVKVDGEERTLALGPIDPLVDGELVVALLKVQQERFPHRMPGHESYGKAVEYFGEYFEALGYEVETFRTPLPPVKVPVGRGISTESPVSVVGAKRGTGAPERYIVFGGHFDVVEQTTHGAFDNTGGTMAVLAMAQTLARFNTTHTLLFAAWGGEEDGILGSQAWLAAHPDLVPFIDLYVNFDVTGLAWPAPEPDPAPIVVALGPDGPAQEALAAQLAEVASTWMRTDAPYRYSTVVQAQAMREGPNAQSDHAPFMARGVPVVFEFTSRVAEVRPLIHSEQDTLENMTRYALAGTEGLATEQNASEMARGEAILARSYEAQMVPAFYLALLTDAGVFTPARIAPPTSFPLANARS